jgi:sugar lactone lactonase YvrE
MLDVSMIDRMTAPHVTRLTALRFRFRIPAVILGFLLAGCGAPTPTIYVVSSDMHTIRAYTSAGVQTGPTITVPTQIQGIAVDAAGKIYVSGFDNTVTTYTAAGARTTPTITGLRGPMGVVVDPGGKIYVANLDDNTVTTYAPDGTPTTPTITGVMNPMGLALDAAGKIYVAAFVDSTITAYTSAGVKSTPTITGLNSPGAFAVDAKGNIYVADGPLEAYNADGTQTPALTPPKVSDAVGVAIDGAGKIYVISSPKFDPSTLRTYNADGTPSTPTIAGLPGQITYKIDRSTNGTSAPSIAVH